MFIDLDAHQIGEHHLQPQEKDILALLLKNEGRVVTHHEIRNHLWGHLGNNGPADPQATILVRVFYIRKKLKGTPYQVISRRRVGYILLRVENK